MTSLPPSPASSLVDLLRTLHGQLRARVDEARRLASLPPGLEAESVARVVHGFFLTTWPRYVAGKQALAGRLQGRDGAIDALLTQLRAGLTEQGVLVERLLALSAPGEARSEHPGELGAVATTLGRQLDEQLGEEERILHPLLDRHLEPGELGELAGAFSPGL